MPPEGPVLYVRLGNSVDKIGGRADWLNQRATGHDLLSGRGAIDPPSLPTCSATAIALTYTTADVSPIDEERHRSPARDICDRGRPRPV